MNQLGNSGRGWSVAEPCQLTSIVDQDEYRLYSNDPTNTLALAGFGKALFVYRDLGNNTILPVKFTDYVNQLDNQGYDLVGVPVQAGDRAMGGASGETLAFFRDADGNPKVRIYPTPEAATEYQIVYATGAVDWDDFEWSTDLHLPEWSHYRCMNVAMDIVDLAEWDGLDADGNRIKQDRRAKNLDRMIGEQREEFEDFIRNPQKGPSIGKVGTWY